MDGIENTIRKPLINLLVAAFFSLLAYLLLDSYTRWNIDIYRQHIPPEVEVANLIDSGSEWGGCGVAIFELTATAKEKLSEVGITALSRGGTSVDADRIGVWQETPFTDESIPESDWAAALGCTWVRAELHEVIYSALRKTGSFYKQYKKGTILVIPTAGIVVYTFIR